MVVLNSCYKTAILVLFLAVFDIQICSASFFPGEPVKWWPDPSTGLMWAEHSYSAPHHQSSHGLTWQKSIDYCAALKLGGFSGWRLPTLDEVKGIAYVRHGVVTTDSEPDMTCHTDNSIMHPCPNNVTVSDPHDQTTLKVPEWNDYFFPTLWLWTSTSAPNDDKSAWMVGPWVTPVLFLKTKDDRGFINPIGALCVRKMDDATLQIAKDSQVDVPVQDIATLKAYVPLNKARLAYEAGQYQESVNQARSALAMYPGLHAAYRGLGIAYGMLGQWNLAITNLKTAYKFDKYSRSSYADLQWAKAGKKAAKKGEKPRIKGRELKDPEWNAPWI